MTGGALLEVAGDPSLSTDTVQFTCSGELPNALTIVLQGSSIVFPANYGDGLKCVAGTVKRLFVKNATGGVVTVPQGERLIDFGNDHRRLGSAVLRGEPCIRSTTGTEFQLIPSPIGGAFNVSNAIAIAWGT
jgi:hypothetical protein